MYFLLKTVSLLEGFLKEFFSSLEGWYFIKSVFVLQEFFFHCMAGREGLVDTAVKTSRSGQVKDAPGVLEPPSLIL